MSLSLQENAVPAMPEAPHFPTWLSDAPLTPEEKAKLDTNPLAKKDGAGDSPGDIADKVAAAATSSPKKLES